MSRKNKNKPETPVKVKKGFRVYAAAVLCLALMLGTGTVAFAAGGDPINVVNNLSDFIFGKLPMRYKHCATIWNFSSFKISLIHFRILIKCIVSILCINWIEFI